MRLQGATYEEVARAGDGILSAVIRLRLLTGFRSSNIGSRIARTLP